MKLVVLNVAYPFAPVGPDSPAGAEQLLHHLDAALACSGHESFVMACEGSVTEGILLATPKPPHVFDKIGCHRIHEQYRFTLQSFIEKWPIDLIHMHGADFYEYLPSSGVPLLVTLHQPIDQYPEIIFHLDRPQTFLQCTSAAQRAACPACPYLLPDEDVMAPEASNIHAARMLDAWTMDKYFGIYERLVAQSRSLETIPERFAATHLEMASAHA